MTESTDKSEQQPPDEASEEENEQIRAQRLDPGNRPDSAEVDNTQRTFDPAAGMFTDNPAYSEVGQPYEPEGEGGSQDGDGDEDPSEGSGESPEDRHEDHAGLDLLDQQQETDDADETDDAGETGDGPRHRA